jgi:hypothetical protein
LPTTPQRAHLLHLGHLLHVPPTAPMAPAAPASYCTYGTCCTCLLLRLPHLLSTPADATNVVGVEGRIKCDNLARPQRLNMRIAKLATSTVNWVLCCRLCKR